MLFLALIVWITHTIGCVDPILVEQWDSIELSFLSTKDYNNPYTDLELTGIFVNEYGDTLNRPGFWDGGKIWKIRFAPPDENVIWTWHTKCSDSTNRGLSQKGEFRAIRSTSENALLKEGLLTMSSGMRNVVHRSGKPVLVVADTPWALPFRATKEQVKVFAKDRQQKGFNAALLMSIQPDTEAEGPNARNTKLGFKRGFNDLSSGHINDLNPDYFQYLDSLVDILYQHELIPVFQPVFHGFGWKGKKVLGNFIDPNEYVRYCRYLLARYGCRPTMWLIAGDNGGRDPGVKVAGEMLEREDCYQQPTGLHYNPCDDYIASWAIDNPIKHCNHFNRQFQAKKWLDFQLAQTGHSDEHLYHKVERMYENKPTKASANGEPTYEGMNDGNNGLGWWQGEEAWMQWMSGGTMGVFYGAASLWQWKITSDEQGWKPWSIQTKSWQEAMQMEGSKYVGLMGKILKGLDVIDIEKKWDWAEGKPLLAQQGRLYISYLNEGGQIRLPDHASGLTGKWVNPKTGKEGISFEVTESLLVAPDKEPWVLIVTKI